MASITFAIDDEIKSDLSGFVWINLSEIARESLIERLVRAERFKKFDEILKNSEMSDELASELANELKKKVAMKHRLSK